MDYSTLSDLEIAILVGKHFPDEVIVSEDYVYKLIPCAASAYTGIDYEEVDFDPCNNVSDAWKVIVENRIFIGPIFVSDWCATSECDSYRSIDKNPLRAAMIVFLMLKGSENVSERMLNNLDNTAKHEDFNTYE